jgi:uncharacterized membrane protein (DUF485 family)
LTGIKPVRPQRSATQHPARFRGARSVIVAEGAVRAGPRCGKTLDSRLIPAQCATKQETTEASMDADLTARIMRDPKYQELKAKRSRFGWWLTLAMMVVYYGFILLVAFDKPFLATRLGSGVTTIGMPIGLGVIVFTIVITGIYVRRANSEYDRLADEVAKGALK